MKNFIAIALTAMLLGGALSSEAEVCRINRRPAIHENVMTNQRVSASKVMESFKAKADELALKSGAEKEETTGTPIESCTGVSKSYSVSSTSYVYHYGWISDISYEGMASEIVYDEAEKAAYLKNPVTYLIHDTYIKGTYTDNQISFQMPQTLFVSFGSTYYAHRMVKDEANSTEEEPAYTVDDSKPLTFTIAADGKVTFDGQGDTVIIGVTNAAGQWLGYGDHDITYEPFNEKVLTIADMGTDFSSHLQEWLIVSDSGSLPVKVAEYNGKIYIAGLDKNNPESLIVGDINGSDVTFKSRQYVGLDKELNYYKYFYGLYIDQAYDEWYDEYYDVYKTDDSAVFTYDAEAHNLVGQGAAIGIVGGMLNDDTGMEVYCGYNDPTISVVPDNISLLPRNPSDLTLVKASTLTASMLKFNISYLNVDGWPLDTDNLYYRVYFKDEFNNDYIYTFSTDDYSGIDENFTDVGYAFECKAQEGYIDIYSGLDGKGSRYVYFYFLAENPGVQVVYKDGAVEHCSNIVYLNGSLGSVKDSMIGKTIVSETYTDLFGRTVTATTTGLYLKTVTYSDGTQTTNKFLIK